MKPTSLFLSLALFALVACSSNTSSSSSADASAAPAAVASADSVDTPEPTDTPDASQSADTSDDMGFEPCTMIQPQDLVDRLHYTHVHTQQTQNSTTRSCRFSDTASAHSVSISSGPDGGIITPPAGTSPVSGIGDSAAFGAGTLYVTKGQHTVRIQLDDGRSKDAIPPALTALGKLAASRM